MNNRIYEWENQHGVSKAVKTFLIMIEFNKFTNELPALPVGYELHIWEINIELFPREFLSYCRNILSNNELEKANRYHFKSDFTRYVLIRGVLRIILAGYLELKPNEIKFSYNQFGKPEVSQHTERQPLYFNVSHSEDMALIAISTYGPVGVDIERRRPVHYLVEIAKRHFTSSEYLELFSVSEEQRLDAFYRCWTKKESYIKAIGKGLSHPLDSFSVPIVDCHGSVKTMDHNSYTHPSWVVTELNVLAGYIAAVSVRSMLPIIHQFSMDRLKRLVKWG